MCGIAGILLKSPPATAVDESRRVLAALDRLRHRGPDDQGFCRSHGLLLGHRRLSILDLSPAGHQPMETGDGRFICSLNGEIYNYLELREELAQQGYPFRTGTDTEVLLAAFAHWGADCLQRFRGQFAFAMWDRATSRLWLARDRVGEKPLYYWRDRERCVFASEIKALLELMPARPALSPDSLNAYLHYQFVIEPDTPLEDVQKLPAGHVLEIAADHWGEDPRAYWDLASVAPADGEPVEHLRQAIESAVTLTLRSDAPVGLALSGGLDSGIIAALASRTRPDLTAFTVGYPGRHDFDERAQAKELSASLGIPWHSAELRTEDFVDFFPALVALMDEPVADVAAYGHFAVSRLAREHGIKVLLTGIGGDELFFGYGWVREALRLSRLKRSLQGSASGGAFTEAVLAEGFKRRLTPRGVYRLMGGMNADHPNLEVAITHLLFDSWLVSNCLDLGDRVSMASSVETRVPLLDAVFVETVLGFWKAGRADDALGHKIWLRAIAKDLLPPHVTDRPKRGFVTPTVEWTQAVNARYEDRLKDGVLVAQGVLDPDSVRSWLRHTPDGIHRYFFQYKLTLLEVWCRVVLHGERPEEMGGRA